MSEDLEDTQSTEFNAVASQEKSEHNDEGCGESKSNNESAAHNLKDDISTRINHCISLKDKIRGLTDKDIKKYHTLHQELMLARIPLLDSKAFIKSSLYDDINTIIDNYKDPNTHIIELIRKGKTNEIDQLIHLTSENLSWTLIELFQSRYHEDNVSTSLDYIFSNHRDKNMDGLKFLLSIFHIKHDDKNGKCFITLKELLIRSGSIKVFLVLTKHFPQIGLRTEMTTYTVGFFNALCKHALTYPNSNILLRYLENYGTTELPPLSNINGEVRKLSFEDVSEFSKSNNRLTSNKIKISSRNKRKNKIRKNSEAQQLAAKRQCDRSLYEAKPKLITFIYHACDSNYNYNINHQFIKLYIKKAGFIDTLLHIFKLINDDLKMAYAVNINDKPYVKAHKTLEEYDSYFRKIRKTGRNLFMCYGLFSKNPKKPLSKMTVNLLNLIFKELEAYLKTADHNTILTKINNLIESYAKKSTSEDQLRTHTVKIIYLILKSAILFDQYNLDDQNNLENYVDDLKTQRDSCIQYAISMRKAGKDPSNNLSVPDGMVKHVAGIGRKFLQLSDQLEKILPQLEQTKQDVESKDGSNEDFNTPKLSP